MSENDANLFEELYLTIQRLESKIDSLQNQLESFLKVERKSDSEWMTLKELQMFLPNHPSESTVRRMVKEKFVPIFRSGKRILVRRTDVEKWLNTSVVTSLTDIQEESVSFFTHKTGIKTAPWRQQSA